ncbi:Hypothetical predicted protein [Mytilus galloprovincialis]|uniref:Uncharacterized protein n=1 Tax=Mytilus galloprovincialis TaxID=29158 RepID=A0A8B6H032_MYTGA|nr:Hypothetical predicted protein [Mytilus galloprovincialis]
MTEDQKKEAKRVAHVKKQNTIADCISSDMNTFQAVVKPDCSKASLQKSTGIKKALKKVISHCIPYTDYSQLDVLLANRGLVFLDINEVPQAIRQSITKATVEFAGVKFKTKATSGEEYLSHVTKGVIGKLSKPSHFPNMNRIVICEVCEEKYSFTPDDFKAATRVKRQKTCATSISHLKLESRILSDDKMSKSALIQTELRKRLISNYLARNLQNLDIKSDIIVDIDSELVLNTSCLHTEEDCSCPYKSYSTPIHGTFSKVDGFLQQQLLHHIKQRKGEAEMSQVDWLDDMKNELLVNDTIVSVVTSADIDSIVIHLLSLSLFWPRDESGSFKNKVYVPLQKQKSELYDITGIIELLESRFSWKSICTIAISLCLGGNDFIPKYQGALQNLVHLSNEPALEKPTGILSEDLYLEIVKRLYCPQNINSELLSLDEVRQISIKSPGKPIRHPKLWMPPKSALKQVLKLINCQIAYLLTTWKHDAVLPDFQKDGCLRKDASGNVHYDFGKDARIEKIEDQLCIDEKVLKGKMDEASSCTKRKRIAGTPVKNNRRKRRPIMSTPVKMKSNQDQDHN